MEENNMSPNEEIIPVETKKTPKKSLRFIIYLLVNRINGMLYVGQTCEEKVEDRMGRKGGKYSNSPRIYEALQTFGHENFFYHTLEYVSSITEATRMEQHYMDEFDTKNQEVGYNVKDASSNGKHHQSTRDQIGETLRANYEAMTQEEKDARVAPIKGWWIGKKRGPQSQKQRDANSEFMKERHKIQGHPMKGKHHSQEARNKIGESSRGKPRSEEVRQKIRAGHLAKINTSREAELIADYQAGMTINAIKEKYQCRHPYRILHRNSVTLLGKHDQNTGKKHTKEARQKQAEARTKFWAEWRIAKAQMQIVVDNSEQ
jgi:hypothetical protein